MSGVPVTLFASFALLGVLLLMVRGIFAARGANLESDYPPYDNPADYPACPSEFVARVFSDQDSRFVVAINSPQLAKLFQSERKRVALAWVRQTSASIQRTMQEHKQVSRTSHDLDAAIEFKLLLFYSELMVLCGILFVAVRAFGPLRLRHLADYAQAHSQRLAYVHQSLKAASSSRELPRVGAA
jgi:hypothetical protein